MPHELTIEAIKARMGARGYDMVKYARMSDGRFRFCEATRDHSTMLADGESRAMVGSAGMLVIRDGGLFFEGRGSHTLRVTGSHCGGDERALEELFGLLFVGPY